MGQWAPTRLQRSFKKIKRRTWISCIFKIFSEHKDSNFVKPQQCMFLKDICTWWISNIFYFFRCYSVWTKAKRKPLQIAILFITSLLLRTMARMKWFLLKIPANVHKHTNALCIFCTDCPWASSPIWTRKQTSTGTNSGSPPEAKDFCLLQLVTTTQCECRLFCSSMMCTNVWWGAWNQAVYKGKKKTQLWVLKLNSNYYF